LRMTLETMRRVLPTYCLPGGWSYYDNMGRISSPFYHDLHIAMLDAMYRLTGEPEFDKYKNVFSKSNSRFNRIRYTLNKIKDKLLDRDAVSD
jgi:heparosan-N-sulfate-glucuronate 5-epimerase